MDVYWWELMLGGGNTSTTYGSTCRAKCSVTPTVALNTRVFARLVARWRYSLAPRLASTHLPSFHATWVARWIRKLGRQSVGGQSVCHVTHLNPDRPAHVVEVLTVGPLHVNEYRSEFSFD
jgi:hypothetical protein